MKPKLLKSSQGYYLAHVSTTTEKPISQSGYIESYEEAKAISLVMHIMMQILQRKKDME